MIPNTMLSLSIPDDQKTTEGKNRNARTADFLTSGYLVLNAIKK